MVGLTYLWRTSKGWQTVSDQDLWPMEPRVDSVNAKKSKLRQMRIFAASIVVALILVVSILIWAAHDRQSKRSSTVSQAYRDGYSTGANPADMTSSSPSYSSNGVASPNSSSRGATTSGSPQYAEPAVRPSSRRDMVDDPADDADANLRMQMLTMRDNYENQLALYRQQLEDQRQLIATQRLLIDQLQAQSKTNTPDAQTGYAGFYRCSNCGAGMNWARTDSVPDGNTGDKCLASANGQHFWIRM